ncbi:hypothetical protein IKJ53_06285, partial [bacterium]|nr:hypothetical protein [bacterium]
MTIGKIFSTLGSPKSLVPLAIKDCASGLGATAGSAITSKEEAKDRFIDEFGSEAIWLGGIPLFKFITDKTLFKATNYDPKYDVRNLENKEIYKKTLEYAPTDKIKKGIKKIGDNQKTFKNLNIGKFVVSTALALETYNILTKAKQNYTENKIRTRLLKQQEQESKIKMNLQKNQNELKDKNFDSMATFRSNTTNENKGNKPNFKGLQSFMLDPVKNMMVLDG